MTRLIKGLMALGLGFGAVFSVAAGARADGIPMYFDEPKMLYPENAQDVPVPKAPTVKPVAPARQGWEGEGETLKSERGGEILTIRTDPKTGCWIRYTDAKEFVIGMRKGIYIFVQMYTLPTGLAEEHPAFMGGRQMMVQPVAGDNLGVVPNGLMTVRARADHTDDYVVFYDSPDAAPKAMTVRICKRTVGKLEPEMPG